MRARLPGAVQLVYDNYNALVIGFGPTEKPFEAIFSIAVLTRYTCLCFLQCGPALRDPKKLLKGSGKLARHIPFTRAEEFDNPAVQELIAKAQARAKKRFDPDAPGRLIIRSASAKQRPRRPPVGGENS